MELKTSICENCDLRLHWESNINQKCPHCGYINLYATHLGNLLESQEAGMTKCKSFHYLSVLKSNSDVFQPEIREAIDFAMNEVRSEYMTKEFNKIYKEYLDKFINLMSDICYGSIGILKQCEINKLISEIKGTYKKIEGGKW